MTPLFKINELIKCCGSFPRYHSANGLHWVECQECGNRSATYMTAGKSANEGWNIKREKQLKVESLYTGKPSWYKKEK